MNLGIPQAKVFITVKTYPQPSSSYGELVCTAGLLNGEQWIRIYPVPFRFLQDNQQYPKYSWITLDLERRARDFRPESYRPRRGIDEPIQVGDVLGTQDAWAGRKDFVLKEVFTSMQELIKLARDKSEYKSLATLKPAEIVDFVIQETDRDWKEKIIAQNQQGDIFETNDRGEMQSRQFVRKLPYKYSYKFLSEGDDRPRTMMIEDWEIGALFWNCLRRTDGDEGAANALVREKYFDTFLEKRDVYLFLGTTLQHHIRSRNPFVIVGVFYPPKTSQLSLF
ncbi:MAG: hypothetical protein OXI94_18485 [Gemmatimonadota bacterium]|nr:hypothetical protein [Gemmatimonadota bacterium]MDE2954662.1 hypothetical protein [Gemmatimonadota bacterium]